MIYKTPASNITGWHKIHERNRTRVIFLGILLYDAASQDDNGSPSYYVYLTIQCCINFDKTVFFIKIKCFFALKRTSVEF